MPILSIVGFELGFAVDTRAAFAASIAMIFVYPSKFGGEDPGGLSSCGSGPISEPPGWAPFAATGSATVRRASTESVSRSTVTVVRR